MSWWTRRSSAPQNTHFGIAAEAEDFLNGQYVETLFAGSGEVPPWAWLSVATHGDQETLKRAEHWLRNHVGARPELDGWGRVLQQVASQILRTARLLDCPVGELQRQLLVPLELAVSLTPVGPATLYRLVNAMLRDLRSQTGQLGSEHF